MPQSPKLPFRLLIAAIVAGARALAAPPPPDASRPSDWLNQRTLTDGWEFERGDLGGVWETLRSDARALDLPAWTAVTLPHCVNASDAVDPDTPYYQGPAWYRTQLEVANPYPGGRTLLQFEGSGQKTCVWIGDRMVAEHVGGYDEFLVDITEAVAAYRSSPLVKLTPADYRVSPGRVPLAVRCDNSRNLEMIPSSLSDFNRYGGLYRPVHLVYLPAGGILRVAANPERRPDGTWQVTFTVTFAGAPLDGTSAGYDVAGPARPGESPIAQSARSVVAGSARPGAAPVTGHDPRDLAPATANDRGLPPPATSPTTASAPAEESLTVRVIDSDGREAAHLVVRRNGTSGSQTLPPIVLPNAQLWSPASPALYGVEVSATGAAGPSRARERFGLRTFEFVDHGPFKLNGERLLLRGTHRHEDQAGVGAAMTPEMMEREMRLMKSMGVNFIRLGHYQQSRRILELCDELGILAWEEIPWCRGGVGGDEYREQARAMLRAMLAQHHNHPAIILWGLGNEDDWPGDFPGGNRQSIREFVRELNALAHRLDPARMTALRRCDYCRDLVDVYSPSIWAGWYRGAYTEYADVLHREMERVPHFFHAEWGGDSHAGRYAEDPYALLHDVKLTGAADERGIDFMDSGGAARASRDGDWSETYLCDLVDWYLKEQEKMPWLTGSAMWPFKDFATPLRSDDPVPFVNQKGAVERDLTPKESFFVYQSYWTTEPMVHIHGHQWPVRWGRAGEKRTVRVYSNCEEVELWLNGVSQGIHRRDSQDFPAAGLHWDLPFDDGVNTLRAVGRGQGREVTDEFSFRYETRNWGKPHHFRLQELAGGEGSVRIQAELLDAGGVVCLDARDFIRFGHAGDGRLLDNLGTPGGSRRVQLANGRAQIDLALPAGGRAVVSVAAENVPTAFLPASRPAAPVAAPSLRQVEADIAAGDRTRILQRADTAMKAPPVSLRSAPLPAAAVESGAKPGDFYSMADYFWPNPKTASGLPYVNRDGESNPDNFEAHRLLMREMRDSVAALASAYLLTRDPAYARRAAEWLRMFFVDPATRMNPHLRFAQAVPGVATGRSYGIIDTLHLVEVPLAINAIRDAPGVPPETIAGVRAWFAEYLAWLTTDPNGRKEAAAKNNHSVAFYLQAAVFARFTGNAAALQEIRRVYCEVLLPRQLAADGSFPRELARTKPYGYSIFQLDNVALLTDVLADDGGDLWRFSLSDGRSVAQAAAFLFPYVADRTAWPYAPDVSHFEGWPVRQPFLLLAGVRLGRPDYVALWRRLPADSSDREINRNMAVTQPLLWLQPWPKQ